MIATVVIIILLIALGLTGSIWAWFALTTYVVLYFIGIPFLKYRLTKWHSRCTNEKTVQLQDMISASKTHSTGNEWCDFFVHLILSEGLIQFQKRNHIGYKSWFGWDRDQAQCMKDAAKGNPKAIALLQEFTMWRLTK